MVAVAATLTTTLNYVNTRLQSAKYQNSLVYISPHNSFTALYSTNQYHNCTCFLWKEEDKPIHLYPISHKRL